MGFLSWLFGHRSSNSPIADKASSAPPELDFVDIPSRRFFGQSTRSPNGRYAIAWADRNPGDGKRTRGRYMLLDGEKVVADGKMTHPNDGRVADTGVFILNDWGDQSELAGTFHAFRPDGKSILAREFKANLYNNGLSDDGKFAVCQTANAPSSDSSLLTVFDLIAGSELAAWQPESGWADSYEFLQGGGTILLCYRERGSFRYSVRGEFIDRDKWLAAELDRGSLHIVARMVEDAKGSLSAVSAENLLKAIATGQARLRTDDSKSHAFALRLKGECLEAKGSPEDALKAYDEALALDPKVGVKRRAEQLRKLSSRPQLGS